MVLPILIRAGGQLAAKGAQQGARQAERRAMARARQSATRSDSDQSSEKEKVDNGYFSFALFLAVIFDGLDILLIGIPVAAAVSPIFLWMFYSNHETRHLKVEVKYLLSGLLWLLDVIPEINFIPALTAHVIIAWVVAKQKAGGGALGAMIPKNP